MAIKGNLRDFSISHLLNLINLAHKSGALVIKGTNGAATVFFNNGKLSYAQVGTEENNLVSILHKANKLSAAQYKAISAREGNINDKEFGLLLINANYFTRQDIILVLQNHFVDIVVQLFSWVEGFFQFENEAIPPKDKVTVRVNLENIILEGSRRSNEMEYLQDEIPNLDLALKFADRPGANVQKINLSQDEWRVVSYINPKNTMKQIAKATNLDENQFRRIAFRLLQAGIIEIVRPAGVPRYAREPGQISISSSASKEEQKSLVNRIISRIRSL
jgi:hypothetical protein